MVAQRFSIITTLIAAMLTSTLRHATDARLSHRALAHLNVQRLLPALHAGVAPMLPPTRLNTSDFVAWPETRVTHELGQAHHLFDLHTAPEVSGAKCWVEKITDPLADTNPTCAGALADGALMRLLCGQRCFERYSAYWLLPEWPMSTSAEPPAQYPAEMTH